MDQQPGGNSRGSDEPDAGVPLKRDRKALRSSKPLSSRQRAEESSTQPEPPSAFRDEPTTVEELFSEQWTATLPAAAMPASTVPPVLPTMPPATEQPLLFEPAAPTRRSTPPPAPTRRSTPPPAEPAEPAEPTRRSTTPPAPARDGQPSHPKLGPLVPAELPDHPELARLDLGALVAAIVLPPAGLVLGIIAVLRAKRIRGWASDLARTAIIVSIAMTVVVVAVGSYVGITSAEQARETAAVEAEQREHASIVAASEPFCETLATHPTIYGSGDPDYGWPALEAPEGYRAAIGNYAAAWNAIAAVAPEGIAAETAAIAARVTNVVNVANALGTENRAGDLLGLHEQEDLATVESWFVQYCPQQ